MVTNKDTAYDNHGTKTFAPDTGHYKAGSLISTRDAVIFHECDNFCIFVHTNDNFVPRDLNLQKLLANLMLPFL